MSDNIPAELKNNWVSNETVMPVDVNSWTSSINQLSKDVPLYAHTGNYYTATYTDNVYNLTPLTFTDNTNNVTLSNYIDGMIITFLCPSNNLANCSVNVNSLGSVIIKNWDNVNLQSSFLKQGYFVTLIYDGINQWFKVINQRVNDAENAVNDGAGDEITETYVKNIDLEDRLHALKGYEDAGELLTDPEGLADVTYYAHSTYCGNQTSDASPLNPKKFTVTGTPTITDDGIVTFTGNTQRVETSNNITLGLGSANSWSIEEEIKVNELGILQTPLSSFNDVGVIVQITNSNSLRLILSNTSTGDIINNDVDLGFTVSLNAKYLLKIEFTGTAYNLYVDNSLIKTITTTTKIKATDRICFFTSTNYDRMRGKQNLKSIKITVDGVPVFSGNKTGIDTIKADDYTVVGTPTISADGIASEFSSSGTILGNGNYLTVPVSFTGASKIIIKSSYVPTDLSTTNILFNIGANLRLALYSNGFIFIDNAGTQILNNRSLTINTNINTDIELTLDNTNGHRLVVHQNGNEIANITSNTTADYSVSDTLSIGGGFYSNYLYGSIDLNSFKIYVDNNLVYQPCLKIPYTLSKTGSKIVDSTYRDRVNDMYEQFGYAPYYTLSDTDFTLPQGELYGMLQSYSDGQWEYTDPANNTVTTANLTTNSPYDITSAVKSLLPDSNYAYECIFYYVINRTSDTTSSGYAIEVDGCEIMRDGIDGGGNSRSTGGQFIAVIKPDSTIKLIIENHHLSTEYTKLAMYRRLGKNN